MADEEEEMSRSERREQRDRDREADPNWRDFTEPSESPAIDFDVSHLDAPGNKLGADEALRVFRKRLPFDRSIHQVMRAGGADPHAALRQPNEIMAEITRKVLATIPESHWTKEFLQTVDVRPLLREAMITPAQVDSPNAKVEIRGQQWTQQEQAFAGQLLVNESNNIEQSVRESMLATVPDDQKQPGTPAYEKAVEDARNIANNWRGEEGAALRPTGAAAGTVYFDQESGEFQNVGGLDPSITSTNDFLGLGEYDKDQTATRFMTRAQVQELATAGELSIDMYGSFETDPLEMRAPVDGQLPSVHTQGAIQYERQGDTRIMGLSPDAAARAGIGSQATKGVTVADKDWYSVRQILSKPGEMTREEVLNIHKKLKDAGLYAVVGGEPTVPGDPTDPAFKAAWKHLASMSLETGKPMTALLAERATAYQNELESSLAVNLTDPARLRITGNSYARDTIGRHLDDDEQAQLQEFIHSLERRNARVEAGLDGTREGTEIEGVENIDEGTMLDIDAQMQEWMRRENSAEAGASDIADQYEMFTNMLSGPGRGVGV